MAAAGDGGYLFTGQELATATHQKLAFPMVIGIRSGSPPRTATMAALQGRAAHSLSARFDGGLRRFGAFWPLRAAAAVWPSPSASSAEGSPLERCSPAPTFTL